jgi:hypothetical protein
MKVFQEEKKYLEKLLKELNGGQTQLLIIKEKS